MTHPTIPINNRELSWMDFNARVLEEAFKKNNPLMERLNFLSITSSNLDEFFMVRVANVKDQMQSNYKEPDASGLTPAELFLALSKKIHTFMEQQYSCWNRSIVPALKKQKIVFVSPEEMNDRQHKHITDYFNKVLFPVLTPLAVDRSRPFPLLANRSLNIAVRLKREDASDFAVVQVPSILPRFLALPSEEGKHAFVLLEQIIVEYLPQLFELHEIKAACPFRITRDSDLDIDEESEDLLSEIQKSIRQRKRGRPVRLEIGQKCDKSTREFLVDMLDVNEHEMYEIPGPLDLTFLSKFASLEQFQSMRFEPIRPVNPPADFWGYDDIFEAIRDKDRLVHHPYESFDSVVWFAQTAATDPDVLAIKQTLYRVSGNSPIIAALIKAAENGKQVTVLVELKARFDEENNIIWAKKLEQAGCHVIYGLAGLKTHCKILLVVRREEDGIRRYLHLATGNYNDSTARFYTDIGMFTCTESLGADASSLFNVITGYSRPPEYNKMIIAPQGMRSFFTRMIQTETENCKKGLPSGITIKINSLVDEQMVELLYQASQAGVPITLVVRGICCLIPGLEGVSENIKVISIVGQLLEHSRIFYFENAGDPKIYLGSADLMPRNLDRRVELLFPVEDEDLRKRVLQIFTLLLSDTVNSRVQLPDTTYVHVRKRGKTAVNCQREFSRLAQEAQKQKENAEKQKPFKPLKQADIQ